MVVIIFIIDDCFWIIKNNFFSVKVVVGCERNDIIIDDLEMILVKNYYYLIKNVFLEILYIVNMFLFIYDSCEEEKN